MEDEIYLVASCTGVHKMTKTKPSLKSGEVAVRLTVEIADKFFDRTIPTGKLVVPADYVMEPEIDIELQEPM